MRIAIFGKYYERLKKNEIIYQTSLVTVIHIASLERMKNLFCLGGLSSVLFCDKERTMWKASFGNQWTADEWIHHQKQSKQSHSSTGEQ